MHVNYTNAAKTFQNSFSIKIVILIAMHNTCKLRLCCQNKEMKHGTCFVHSEIATYFYICNSSIMFVYYINFSYKEKSYCFFLGASVPSLIFLLAVILRVHAMVLYWGVRSGVHNTHVCLLPVPMQD